MFHSNVTCRAHHEEENRNGTSRKHVCQKLKPIVMSRETEVPSEDRGSTTAVRCKAPHRAKFHRSLRDKYGQNRGVQWNLVAGPERPTQRKKCEGSQRTDTPAEQSSLSSAQQPNTRANPLNPDFFLFARKIEIKHIL